MKLFKRLFGLIRLILLLAALLMGGIAFFRTGGFSDIKWDINDIKESINKDLFSKLSNNLQTQAKSAKDIANIQTLILRAKLAIIESKDFDSATRNLGTAREILSKMKNKSKNQYYEQYDKTIKKIDELAKEIRSGIYISSNKFEEILLNLDILDKSR